MALILKDNGISPNMMFDTLKPILSEIFYYIKTQLTPQSLGFDARYKNVYYCFDIICAESTETICFNIDFFFQIITNSV
jgi:hypothetical protein